MQCVSSPTAVIIMKLHTTTPHTTTLQQCNPSTAYDIIDQRNWKQAIDNLNIRHPEIHSNTPPSITVPVSIDYTSSSCLQITTYATYNDETQNSLYIDNLNLCHPEIYSNTPSSISHTSPYRLSTPLLVSYK
jgi:hypothetical protein